jgi:subtilisin family serine protease
MEFSLCPTDYEGNNKDCTKAPHIVSNSWGSSDDKVGQKYEDAIDAWIAAGIIPIFAAGNSGKDCETMGSPGASENVISVGATDENDNIADFSSRGPVKASKYLKPEVSAPGVDVESAHHRNANQYTKMSGTSMACPHVAGLAALLMQDTIRQTGKPMNFYVMREVMQGYSVRNVLKSNGQECGGTRDNQWPNNIYGHGRVDAIKIMERDTQG